MTPDTTPTSPLVTPDVVVVTAGQNVRSKFVKKAAGVADIKNDELVSEDEQARRRGIASLGRTSTTTGSVRPIHS